MKFRVFNDYEQDERDIIQPALDSGYRDIEIDWENEHKYFYLKLANCFKVGEDLEVINSGEEIQEKIEELVLSYGNLGCYPIEREYVEVEKLPTNDLPTFWIKDGNRFMIIPKQDFHTEYAYDAITRRPPSKKDHKTNTFIANGDFFNWQSNIDESIERQFENDVIRADGTNVSSKVNYQAVSNNPSLPKALLDLTILLKQFELGLEVNLELLETHLIQSNVISVTKRDIVNGHQVYKTIPSVDNLLGLAFWQFQQLLLENNPGKIAVCAMCGSYFEKKSHKGRFCNETISGTFGDQAKLNPCTSCYNSLKTRVKKNYVKDASLTIDDLAKKHRCSIELIIEFVDQWQKDNIQRANDKSL